MIRAVSKHEHRRQLWRTVLKVLAGLSILAWLVWTGMVAFSDNSIGNFELLIFGLLILSCLAAAAGAQALRKR